jgi:hypothetical protein
VIERALGTSWSPLGGPGRRLSPMCTTSGRHCPWWPDRSPDGCASHSQSHAVPAVPAGYGSARVGPPRRWAHRGLARSLARVRRSPRPTHSWTVEVLWPVTLCLVRFSPHLARLSCKLRTSSLSLAWRLRSTLLVLNRAPRRPRQRRGHQHHRRALGNVGRSCLAADRSFVLIPLCSRTKASPLTPALPGASGYTSRATVGQTATPPGIQLVHRAARNVVMAAQNEAHAANTDEIRPEHLVLELMTEPDALGTQAIIAQKPRQPR